MRRGIVTFLTDYGIDAVRLATAVEERGFDALFLTEHTHIPVSRQTPWPGGAELPKHYAHTFDPFVALAAMAAVTERVTLGKAVSLIAQHDPIVLAKAVASLDRIAGGRVELGIGPGWNVEEMANHGVDPAKRTARMLEHLAAMRAVWTADEAEFHGRYIDFDPIWSWPKPVRIPPVLLGGGGPTVLERVVAHGDGWLPLRIPAAAMPEFAARITRLHELAADAGRERPSVTLFGGSPKPEALASYEEAGVDVVLFELPDATPDDTLRTLDELAAL